MRQIGSLANEQHARLLVDYLLTQGISAQADANGSEVAVWVRDENQVDSAKEIFQAFSTNPHESRYQSAVDHAAEIRTAQMRHLAGTKAKQVAMRQIWSQPLSRRAPLVFALIGLCVFATLATNFGQIRMDAFFNALMFCDTRTFQATHDGLQQIKQGQLWRLVTPIFLHGSLPHLLFNSMCLYSLATQIEMRRGTVFLGVLTLALAVVSNLAQFFIGRSPMFLGISGVVYGYFGYIWIRTKVDPHSGYLLGESTVFFMLFVLVLGFAGLLNGITGGAGIANWCHAGGLLTGIAASLMVRSRS